MKAMIPPVLWAAFLAVALPGVAFAADIGGHGYRRHMVLTKEQYCTGCHGLSAQGWRGYYPIPRLAGQTTEYVENQLRAFSEGRREAHMAVDMSKVHDVSPALRASLSMHFEELHSPAIIGGPRRLVDEGKKIFGDGIPEENVPACAACHGPEALGSGINPRLAGQLYPYLVKELVNWSKERTQKPGAEETSAVMVPIAQSLTKPQIEAVAAYLSHLK